MHQFWHRKGFTDLDVMREDANRRLLDRYHPEESIIHMHDSKEPCDIYKHEEFRFPEQKVTTEEQGTDIIKKDMEEDMIKSFEQTWNDADHDGPRL